MPSRLLAIVTLAALAAPVAAQAPVDEAFFEAKVRPILVQHCQSCHGPDKHKGELRLDTKAGFDKGGETGPSVVPGDPGKSLLAQAIRYDGDLKMPPKGKLPDADIAVLTTWVKGGAPWPAEKATTPGGPKDAFDIAARAKAHWSFQPIKRPAVPEARTPPSAPRTPIDAFLLAKLDAAGLAFAPPADKRALIRRVAFDLTGLPPTPEEVEAFAADPDPRAYEKRVDRLLASPAYGERWGRHWLDLARYAETSGHEFDFEIPDAWRYRDYVVRAFNADVSYNQFLTELLAGDLLPPRRNPADGANESLTATGFWWLGEAKHSPVDARAEFADRVDNQIDAFGKGVLGLTLACARCHDHKFDPVSAKDYYALFGVLASSRYHRADVSDPAPAGRLLDELKAARAGEKDAADTLDATSPQLTAWREKAVPFERFGPGWRERWDAAGLAFRPGAGDGYPHSGRESARLAGALRSPTFVIDKPFLAVRVAGQNGRARLVLNGLQLIMSPIYGGLAHAVDSKDALRWQVLDLRMWKGQPAYFELLDDGPGFVAITEAWFSDAPPPAAPGTVPLPPGDEKTKAVEAKLPPQLFAPTIRDGAGRNEKIAVRGNHKTPGAEAPRAFLEVFDKTPLPGHGSGRLELARKVTDPANPLVARVIVNRLWKHHFAEGIVRSPDDFGYQGQPPTHPELLDWLAAELVTPTEPGAAPWSLKRMHRLMVLSAAYRQGSRAMPEQAAKAVTADPLNKLLHRQNVRRLEAEAIRDAMLAVSGRLDRTVGGPGVLPHLTEHQVGRGRPASGPLDGNGRRSLYLAVRRNFLNPMFVAFDYPTPFTAIGRRTVSNVPAQALVMLNNPFVIQQADLWARRVLAEPGRTADERVTRMYEAAFGRAPAAEERATAAAFLAEQAREYGRPDDPRAWADLAHALFNAKEFIFID
ncbi:MAG TPA: PSD1 and planctomycete cytochrome C domain-containing protein [Urbifossiella sp.]|jgi:mono/diheme cytochrome c family protein|nr:PSD1 and planctomycete cytochrome C domain-containing protein [Urbifossiella sp.]